LFLEAALAAGDGNTCPTPLRQEAGILVSWQRGSSNQAPETGL